VSCTDLFLFPGKYASEGGESGNKKDEHMVNFKRGGAISLRTFYNGIFFVHCSTLSQTCSQHNLQSIATTRSMTDYPAR